jgi:23S rRNA (guanine2445-N2)-methyltransferase / 23S rRNA (guanine2069-N7)-methyltransferase
MSDTVAFATASKGTSVALGEELRELGISPVEVLVGGVAFGSDLRDAYRACLWSRVASRVLLPLTTFEAQNEAEFYDGIRTVSWLDHLNAGSTLAVSVAGSNAPAGPPHFLTLVTKDAIVDAIRDASGSRPNVDTDHPDVRINVHLAGARTTVSIDLAGTGLHKRGLPRRQTAAPLRETLAAALLHIAGWPAVSTERPFFDPMCGSGTLLSEAAAIACDVAPGLARKRFGAERWLGHDASLWNELRQEAEIRAREGRLRKFRIGGADASSSSLEASRAVLGLAGWKDRIRLVQSDLRETSPPWDDPGILMTNPPYGERLGEAGELGPLYEALGDLLKQRFPGWTGWILSGNRALDRCVGLRAASRHELWNGPIECRLLEFPINAKPVEKEGGPGWRRPGSAAGPFTKKLQSNFRKRKKQARSQNLEAYRIYDSDIPEFNLSVDWYAGAVRVEEYERPERISARASETRLQEALRSVPEALGVDRDDVTLRVRRRRKGREQIEKFDDRGKFRTVREGEFRFRVNLTDYLDTGLFCDDRLMRQRICEHARGKSFLNLFAYTCTASVAAALGGAKSTSSVDLSGGYLDWGRKNFELNKIDPGNAASPWSSHKFIRADALDMPGGDGTQKYDLIFVAPPTWSRSKSMREGDFDIQRDHGDLLEQLVNNRLAPGGILWFTTNHRQFVLDEPRFERIGVDTEEITRVITPFDFENRPRLKAWEFRAD